MKIFTGLVLLLCATWQLTAQSGKPHPMDRLTLEDAIRKKTSIIVMSPHLDDGIWSCGGLMYLASRAGCEVEMITVHSGNPVEAEIPRLQQKEISDKGSLELRKKEDKAAADVLGVGVTWWDYPTRLLRQPWLRKRLEVFDTPEGDRIMADGQYKRIREQVDVLLRENPTAILLCPMVVGHMYDHVELFTACIQAGYEAEQLHRMYFYEDSYAILTGPRREHFLLQDFVWNRKGAPERTTFWWRMMGRVMSKSSSGTDIRTCIPADLRRVGWSHELVNISGVLDTKLESLAAYDSQMSQFGGMKRVGKGFRSYHEFWQGCEPYWYITE